MSIFSGDFLYMEEKKQRKYIFLKYLGSTSLLGLGGQQACVDVGQDTTLGNGDMAQQLVQFLVVADGQLQMAGDDTRLLVVAGSVAGQFEDFGGQVLEHGGQVDGGTGTDALGVVATAQQAVDTANGELKTGLGGTGLRLGASSGFASRFASRHG